MRVQTSTCRACGKSFTHRPTRDSKFCSWACFQAVTKARPRACPTCGQEFVRWASDPCQHCSYKCWRQDPNWRYSFWRFVNKTDSCWLWTGTTDKDGYGKRSVNNKTIRAHRVSYEMAYGPIPKGLFVCHRCDTPGCVRPDHLFLGTVQDNNRDRDNKGHTARTTPNAKLTREQVIEIRKLLESNVMHKEIAHRHSIAPSVISNIRHGKTWADVR